MNIKKQKILPLIIIIASIALVAGLGSLFVNLGMPWYKTLTTPSQYVPQIVFPIVWSTVYISYAIILCLWEYKEGIPQKTTFLLIANGILNVLWCLTYFTLHQTLLGVVVIIFNLVFALLLWVNIYQNKKLYSYILSLYPLWIAVATALNLATWILN